MIRYEIKWNSLPEQEMNFDIRLTGRLRFWRFNLFSTDENADKYGLYAFWGKLKLWPKSESKKNGIKSQNKSESQNKNDKKVINKKVKDKEKGKKVKEEKSKKKKKISISKIKSFLEDSSNQRAIAFTWNKLAWFLVKSKPKEMRGEVDFSLGDPANTGMATGVISLCPAAYGKHLSITPDFASEDLYAQGTLYLKGIVFYRHLVYLIFSIAFDKDCRKAFSSLR